MADERSKQIALIQQTLNHNATFQQLINTLPVAADKKEIEAKRLISQVINAMSRTPDLYKCTPRSVAQCMLLAAELGLELSGPLGEAYLIPRKNKSVMECNFQIGYKGIRNLAFRSGLISNFPAYVVRANDEFDFQLGDTPHVFHRPSLKDRGDPIATYAVINFRDGGKDVEVWSWDDIIAHRNRYSPSHGSQYSPWQTAPEAMAKKTVMIQVGKRAPLATQLNRACNIDEYGNAGIKQILPQISNEAMTTQARIADFKKTFTDEIETDEFGTPIFQGDEQKEKLVQNEPGELG